MKKNSLYIIILLSVLIALQACEKNIDIDLPTPEPMLVVDGFIENDDFAKITISRSIPYFDIID
ncbi:MAG: DUF4249 family protein, partial [Flavobacteriales bacterium]|nr:DUF4249 family protein [Flavobacteriales bacterium]